MKRERFECYIYAKLLIIIICWKLFWSVNKHTYKTEKSVVSGYKFFRTILSNIIEFSKVWYNDCLKDQVTFVYNLCLLSEKHLLCETKKDHKSYMDTIMNALHCDTVSRKTNLTNSIEGSPKIWCDELDINRSPFESFCIVDYRYPTLQNTNNNNTQRGRYEDEFRQIKIQDQYVEIRWNYRWHTFQPEWFKLHNGIRWFHCTASDDWEKFGHLRQRRNRKIRTGKFRKNI